VSSNLAGPPIRPKAGEQAEGSMAADRSTRGKPPGKMAISADKQRALDAKIAGDKVLSNAFRLTKDADALFQRRSFASCVALAALAFEEIGKHLLAQWSKEDAAFTYDRRRLHQAKQDAVASVIACDSMRREYVSAGIDFSALMKPGEMDKLALAVVAGFKKVEGNINATMRGKGMELVKWSGMYYDENMAAKGIEPAKITGPNAASVMHDVSRAFMAIADDKAVAIGKAFFKTYHKPGAATVIKMGPTSP